MVQDKVLVLRYTPLPLCSCSLLVTTAQGPVIESRCSNSLSLVPTPGQAHTGNLGMLQGLPAHLSSWSFLTYLQTDQHQNLFPTAGLNWVTQFNSPPPRGWPKLKSRPLQFSPNPPPSLPYCWPTGLVGWLSSPSSMCLASFLPDFVPIALSISHKPTYLSSFCYLLVHS